MSKVSAATMGCMHQIQRHIAYAFLLVCLCSCLLALHRLLLQCLLQVCIMLLHSSKPWAALFLQHEVLTLAAIALHMQVRKDRMSAMLQMAVAQHQHHLQRHQLLHSILSAATVMMPAAAAARTADPQWKSARTESQSPG